MRTSRGMQLLETLEKTVAEFAKREEELNKDLRARQQAVERRLHEASGHTESHLAAQVAETEAALKAQEERIEARYASRRARVERTQKNRVRNLPRRARETRDRWMSELQMQRFRLERQLASDLNALEQGMGNPTQHVPAYSERQDQMRRQAGTLFGGYGGFLRRLRRKSPRAGEPVPQDPGVLHQMLVDAGGHLDVAEQELPAFKALALPKFFAMVPLWMIFIVALLIGAAIIYVPGASQTSVTIAGIAAAAIFLVFWVLHFMGGSQGGESAKRIAGSLVEARRLLDLVAAGSDKLREDMRQRYQGAIDEANANIQEQSQHADSVQKEFERTEKARIDAQYPRVMARIDAAHSSKVAAITSQGPSQVQGFHAQAESQRQEARERHATESSAYSSHEKTSWETLQSDWKERVTHLHEEIVQMNETGDAEFPAWSQITADTWQPPRDFTSFSRFGRLDVDLAQRVSVPKDPRLALPAGTTYSLPISLSMPDEASVLFEGGISGEPAVVGTLNNIILRLLAKTPPGKVAFTIIDPVGLGQNFAGLMHLADYEEGIINRRIWTQRDQIEERLAELGEHIEKVIQMYLRNEYATITEYNEQAGSVAEKYHFLIVADFPANFSEVAARRLQSIATSGPRCGVYTLIHWDQRQPLPDGFSPDELQQSSIRLIKQKDRFILGYPQAKTGTTLTLDAPPLPEDAAALAHRIGKASIDSNRVEVPFEQIAPAPGELWTGDTTNELRIAIGRTGATKLQYLAIGKGTRQHALFAGKTGSGKSTLFHIIITNLALTCSPDQVEFYLIDFKKGVEFKCYAENKLPHARVVAIESDREFGLSVLQRVDDELKRRGDIFRKLGVQDVAGYKRAGGAEPMPRSLLIIDEFQEFFVDDDTIAQTASLLFDRIVRQGRAFGIHVLLGSQTLGGSYSLARATLGQMVIRVALQCNEADAYLIMDENNAAPRLLSRPGEGIYNDAAGAIEGNSPFQVCWLSDEERDKWLAKVHEMAVAKNDEHPAPVVFEGNAPADIRENERLRHYLLKPPATAPVAARCWLGAPNSIKGPTEAVFHRQSGNHLLVVGQRDEAAVVMLGMSMLSLAAQHPPGTLKIVLFHSANPGSQDAEFFERVAGMVPHEVTVARGQDISGAMEILSEELKTRTVSPEHGADAPRTFLIVHGLHKFKKLRQEDDFSFSMDDSSGSNPASQFNTLITEGSGAGIHVITTVDTYNNLNRSMSRKALGEFEMRVVFQMSANDSASLIDSPKAGNLGLHRALYYNEQEGTLETFRPYAAPDATWLQQASEHLVSRSELSTLLPSP
ncbi:FtsK/SpoIIIE domain-containing protein [Roseimicrobium gellanilyticum]|nr:FtsK/SpoIIIE domain-containing protein [Roseimicrobium gellanilyticum]